MPAHTETINANNIGEIPFPDLSGSKPHVKQFLGNTSPPSRSYIAVRPQRGQGKIHETQTRVTRLNLLQPSGGALTYLLVCVYHISTPALTSHPCGLNKKLPGTK